MLTIQPNFTTKQYVQKNQRPVHFKGIDEGEGEITEEYIRKNQAFYAEQAQKAEELINNNKSPEVVKKGMRIVKIVSDGIWEGLAVLWGAKVGSKVVKKSTIKTINSKAAKGFGKKVKEVGKLITKGLEKLSQSSLAKKAGELVDKLDNTKVGKYIVATGKAAVKAVKSAVGFIQDKSKKIKQANIETVYDKVTNGASTVLGVGSGAAASYSTAMKQAPVKVAYTDNDDVVNDDYYMGGDD